MAQYRPTPDWSVESGSKVYEPGALDANKEGAGSDRIPLNCKGFVIFVHTAQIEPESPPPKRNQDARNWAIRLLFEVAEWRFS